MQAALPTQIYHVSAVETKVLAVILLLIWSCQGSYHASTCKTAHAIVHASARPKMAVRQAPGINRVGRNHVVRGKAKSQQYMGAWLADRHSAREPGTAGGGGCGQPGALAAGELSLSIGRPIGLDGQWGWSAGGSGCRRVWQPYGRGIG